MQGGGFLMQRKSTNTKASLMDEGSWRSDGGMVIEVKGGGSMGMCTGCYGGAVLVQTGLEKKEG